MSQTVSPNRFIQFIDNVLFEDDPQPMIQQVVIEPGMPYTLPRSSRRIEMLIGEAWVSHLGHDVLLKRGQATLVNPQVDAVVISAIGDNPIVLNQYR